MMVLKIVILKYLNVILKSTNFDTSWKKLNSSLYIQEVQLYYIQDLRLQFRHFQCIDVNVLKTCYNGRNLIQINIYTVFIIIKMKAYIVC